MNKLITQKVKNSPNLPGVYIFYNHKEIIYIGKATNLNKRLQTYLNQKIKKNQIINQYANNLKWIITQNDIEALLLESKLIKKHLPRINIILKDNKNYFFIKITNDTFPKVFITHNENDKEGIIIGPFTSGTHLKNLLKLLRPIFPFCTCKTNHKKSCINTQLNLCPGYCCQINASYTNTQKKQYQNNINNLIQILKFNNDKILKNLYLNLNLAIQNQEFEQADIIKKQILAINNIFKHQQLIDITNTKNYTESLIELSKLFNSKNIIRNIEMYDVSNIVGKFATASLVFFTNGISNKKEYKKFKIRYTKLQPNDILMLKEVFNRRINNIHWLNPDLILIDGGISQLKTAISVFHPNENFKNTFLGSLAKGKKQLLIYVNNQIKYIDLKDLSNNLKNLLVAIQNESHRFAIAYHHKLYSQQLKNDQ